MSLSSRSFEGKHSGLLTEIQVPLSLSSVSLSVSLSLFPPPLLFPTLALDDHSHLETTRQDEQHRKQSRAERVERNEGGRPVT